MQIKGNTFLISGGSSGLGAACVRLYSKAGGNVVIADTNSTAGERLAKELGPNVSFAYADVTDENNVDNAVRLAVEKYGNLRVAISCAGIAPGERILGKSGPHSLATFSQVINVNLIGTFNVLRLASAAIARIEPELSGERGVIINTSSVAAFEGQIGQVAYSASKGGIMAMTIPAARELSRFAIRVVTIAPGIFDTPLLAGLPETVRQSLAEQVPYPARLGTPEEFASLTRHIVENEMLNGETIRLDGALRMAPK